MAFKLFQMWLKYICSAQPNENAVLTEAVLVYCFKKQWNDPKLKASVEDIWRGFLDAMDTNEEGYIQREEFRRFFDDIGLPNTSFAEQAFNRIDSNHDGKLSVTVLTHAYVEFMFSEDEDSPYNLCWGPLI